MDNNDDLKDAINELKESVDGLTTIQQDLEKVGIHLSGSENLSGKIHELLTSNEELRKAILKLNDTINSKL
jgi:cell division septum initiation protein DivIVA